jgi:hypothetical protein
VFPCRCGESKNHRRRDCPVHGAALRSLVGLAFAALLVLAAAAAGAGIVAADFRAGPYRNVRRVERVEVVAWPGWLTGTGGWRGRKQSDGLAALNVGHQGVVAPPRRSGLLPIGKEGPVRNLADGVEHKPGRSGDGPTDSSLQGGRS